jgi:hypothetical protein
MHPWPSMQTPLEPYANAGGITQVRSPPAYGNSKEKIQERMKENP